MKFGSTWDEVQSEPVTGGGAYLKYFRNGDTTFRIIQEPNDWVGYWEHFNPEGFSFPCTGDRKSCPGCTSDNQKMSKASRKIIIQVLEGEYVNAYKFPRTLADKLANRAERLGTIRDRDYTISRFKSGDKVEYDIEGGDKIPVDFSKLSYLDVEKMLQDSFNESWGDSEKAQRSRDGAAHAQMDADLKANLKAQEERPDFKSAEAANVYDEADLRAMSKSALLGVMQAEKVEVPKNSDDMSVDELVDWLLEQ